MRRHPPISPRPTLLALVVLACAVSAAAQNATPAAAASALAAPAQVQLAPLPDTAQFNQNVDLRTRPAGESLDALVQALARSVGLSAITQGIPADAVGRYNLSEPKPFREVWDIVLTLNGLEYVLRGDDIVVVGPPDVLASLQPQRNDIQQPTVLRTYKVPSAGGSAGASGDDSALSQLASYLTSQFPRGSNITVIPFEQLGALSVRASISQQARIAKLLRPFNAVNETKVRRVYALSYARAEDIATIFQASQPAVPAAPATTTTLSGGNVATNPENAATTTGNGATGNGATTNVSTPSTSGQAAVAASFAEGELVVTPDPRTNRILVFGSERVQAEIARLIGELDQPERQVNVQVRIQEVTSDVTERLGIDLISAIGNFTTSLFSGDDTSGLSFIFDAQKAVSGFNLGAVLDAFERQGLSRRVDDSNITVLNNGEATLQAGGTIYISIPGADANIERTIPYGVQIDLTPQITNNDEIILDVTGRVDAVISETDNPNFLELSTRNLTSRVSLKPGQTVVLGGLLQNELTDASRKVPGLGDVPIVGNLFSSSNKQETKTELLVIVTANVLE